ncbi:MFS transporter, partial [Pseudonocardia acaciae]|uniref:MFS transporter n=1 Tax=Pseudonocardia acaciae TaxID=551276 RepID=UPI0005641C22
LNRLRDHEDFFHRQGREHDLNDAGRTHDKDAAEIVDGVQRQRDFEPWYRGGAFVDGLGSATASNLLDHIASSLGASPTQVSWLTIVSRLTSVLVGLPAGPLVERAKKRQLMIGIAIAQAALTLSFAAIVAGWTGPLHLHLHLWQLYTVTAVGAALSVFFRTATAAHLRALIPNRLGQANKKIKIDSDAAYTAGPIIGGFLTPRIGPAGTMLVDAVSYLISAGALRRIRTAPEESGASSRPATQQARAHHRIWSDLTAGNGYVAFLMRVPHAFPVAASMAPTAAVVGVVLGAVAGPRIVEGARDLVRRWRHHLAEHRQRLWNATTTSAAYAAYTALPLGALHAPAAVTGAVSSAVFLGGVLGSLFGPSLGPRLAVMRADIAEGVRFVIGQKILLTITAHKGVAEFFFAMYVATSYKYMADVLHFSLSIIGATATFALGFGLLATVIEKRLAVRFGSARAFLLAPFLIGPVGLLYSFAPVHWWWGPAFASVGLGAVFFAGRIKYILSTDYSARAPPKKLQSRVGATSMWLMNVGMLVGAWVGGELAEHGVGLRATSVIAMAGYWLASLVLVFSPPLRAIRDFSDAELDRADRALTTLTEAITTTHTRLAERPRSFRNKKHVRELIRRLGDLDTARTVEKDLVGTLAQLRAKVAHTVDQQRKIRGLSRNDLKRTEHEDRVKKLVDQITEVDAELTELISELSGLLDSAEQAEQTPRKPTAGGTATWLLAVYDTWRGRQPIPAAGSGPPPKGEHAGGDGHGTPTIRGPPRWWLVVNRLVKGLITRLAGWFGARGGSDGDGPEAGAP